MPILFEFAFRYIHRVNDLNANCKIYIQFRRLNPNDFITEIQFEFFPFAKSLHAARIRFILLDSSSKMGLWFVRLFVFFPSCSLISSLRLFNCNVVVQKQQHSVNCSNMSHLDTVFTLSRSHAAHVLPLFFRYNGDLNSINVENTHYIS